jgi:hypothetical protein
MSRKGRAPADDDSRCSNLREDPQGPVARQVQTGLTRKVYDPHFAHIASRTITGSRGNFGKRTVSRRPIAQVRNQPSIRAHQPHIPAMTAHANGMVEFLLVPIHRLRIARSKLHGLGPGTHKKTPAIPSTPAPEASSMPDFLPGNGSRQIPLERVTPPCAYLPGTCHP